MPFVAASALATFNDALAPIASAAATVDIATIAASSTMAQFTSTKHPFYWSHFFLATVSWADVLDAYVPSYYPPYNYFACRFPYLIWVRLCFCFGPGSFWDQDLLCIACVW